MDTQQQTFNRNQQPVVKQAKNMALKQRSSNQMNSNRIFGSKMSSQKMGSQKMGSQKINQKMTTIPAKINTLSPQVKRKFGAKSFPKQQTTEYMIYEDKENQPQSLQNSEISQNSQNSRNSQKSQNSLRAAIELADQALEESADVLMETSYAEEVFEENFESENFETANSETENSENTLTSQNYLLYNDKNFQDEILDFVYLKEKTCRPENYLRKQKEVSTDMRTILIDWLIEVSYSSNSNYYSPDVLPLATNYIDRFLSKMGVPKSKLQLLGIVCLMLASKMLDTIPPDVIQLCELTDNTYTHNQVKKMEILVLEALEFNMYPPVHSNFYNYFLDKFCNAQPDIDYTALDRSRKALSKRSYSALICQFITEMTLLDYRLSTQYMPSQIALSAVIISRVMLNKMIKKDNLPEELKKSHLLASIDQREPGLIESVKKEGVLTRELRVLVEEIGLEQMKICIVGMITLWRSILAQEKIVAIVEKFCVQSIQEAFLDFRLACLYGAPGQEDVMKALV